MKKNSKDKKMRFQMPEKLNLIATSGYYSNPPTQMKAELSKFDKIKIAWADFYQILRLKLKK